MQAYVNSKKKACAEVGFNSFGADLDEKATEEEVLQVRVGAGRVAQRDGGARVHALHGGPRRMPPCSLAFIFVFILPVQEALPTLTGTTRGHPPQNAFS